MVRSSLFWYVAWRGLVVGHRLFGTTCLTLLQGSSIPKRKHTLVECTFFVIFHFWYYLSTYWSPHFAVLLLAIRTQQRAVPWVCSIIEVWRVVLSAYTFNRHVVPGPLFLREHAFAITCILLYYQEQCCITVASGLTPICSRFLWTHWYYRYPAFPIHHSNRDVTPYSSITAREVCDRCYHNLGPLFGPHLWPGTWLRWQKVRKLNCPLLLLRDFNCGSRLQLNCYAAVNVLTF